MGVGGTVTEHNLFVVGVSPAGQKGKPGGTTGGVGVGVGGTVTEHNLFVVGVSPAGQRVNLEAPPVVWVWAVL